MNILKFIGAVLMLTLVCFISFSATAHGMTGRGMRDPTGIDEHTRRRYQGATFLILLKFIKIQCCTRWLILIMVQHNNIAVNVVKVSNTRRSQTQW